MTLLRVENLSVGYQTRQGMLHAVEGMSFLIDKGASFGLVGESGCGKSTLGMSLMGLLPANGSVLSGQMLYCGDDLLGRSASEMRMIRWREISMIFQGAMNALNPVHRVEDQIREAIEAHLPGLSDREVDDQVSDLFKLVSIPANRVREYPHQFSGGMKQRAVIAMALACKPKLIIADEPTTALDVIVQDQILGEIRQLQNALSISLLFISHDIAVVARMCSTIGVMYAGQLIELGSREDVIETPCHPYTQALLRSYPTIFKDTAAFDPIPGEAPNLVTPPAGCRFLVRCPVSMPTCSTGLPGWAAVSDGHRVRCIRHDGSGR